MKENGKITCKACWVALTSNKCGRCTLCIDAGRPERPNPVAKTPRKRKGSGVRVTHSAGSEEARISKIYRPVYRMFQ